MPAWLNLHSRRHRGHVPRAALWAAAACLRFPTEGLSAANIAAPLDTVAHTAQADRPPATGPGERPAGRYSTPRPPGLGLEDPACPGDLGTVGLPDSQAVVRLIALFEERDPVYRQAAIIRLIPCPQPAAAAVVEVLANGPLSAKLAALELLSYWQAPVEGLDPWRPETLTSQKLDTLSRWLALLPPAVTTIPTTLSDEQMRSVQRDIQRYLTTEHPTEQLAVRERLAAWGTAVGPDALQALIRENGHDQARNRLAALRYRLQASLRLAVMRPDVFDRLAAEEPSIRRQAVAELCRLATPQDEPLLIELVRDNDPLVRDASLKALGSLAGPGSPTRLVRLLNDPDGAVRAAVLAYLALHPSAELVPPLADFLEGQPDPELVSQIIRVLRAVPGRSAIPALLRQIKHPHWQVRAEAADALGEKLRQGNLTGTHRREVTSALIDRLDDAEGFVVSRALEALEGTATAAAVEPLLRVIERLPDLAGKAARLLSGEPLRTAALPRLTALGRHPDPAVRGTIIRTFSETAAPDMGEIILAGLNDESGAVRMEALRALRGLIEEPRQKKADTLLAIITAQPTEAARSPHMPEKPDSAEEAGAGRPDPAAGLPQRPPDTPSAAPDSEDLGAAGTVSGHASGVGEDESDRWLASFQAGRAYPGWMGRAVEPLNRMLTAAPPEEKVEAAAALIAMGHRESALMALIETVEDRPDLLTPAASCLPWLPTGPRLTLFHRLLGLSDARHVHALIEHMVAWPGPATAAALWNVLDEEGVRRAAGSLTVDAIRRCFLGRGYEYRDALPAAGRRALIAEATRQLTSGSWPRVLAALTILAGHDPDRAADAARRILLEPGHPPGYLADIFQLLLVSLPPEQADRTAVEALLRGQELFHPVALWWLGPQTPCLEALLNEGFRLCLGPRRLQGDRNVRPAPLRAPPGLTVPVLQPFLDRGDERLAASAGYLLALLGDRRGLNRLLAVWRTDRGDPVWRRLVYRAVVALDDDRLTDLLREVLDSFRERERDIREFYWTLQLTDGPAVRALRASVREKTGPDWLE